MKNIFISDLHMGVNYKTNIYQQSFHEKYLKAILKYVQDNAASIQDVVILGDWLDFWMYPTHYKQVDVMDVVNANKGVFMPGVDGDFVTCMDSIQGDLVYVSGNHDMTLDIKTLQKHFSSQSKKGKTLVNKGNFYLTGNIRAEHGHACTYFNAPDNHKDNKYAPLPIGFYMTRLGAVSCEKQLTASDCSQVQGNSYPTVAQMLKKDMLPYAQFLANPVAVTSIVGFVQFKPSEVILSEEAHYAGVGNTEIVMGNDKSIKVNDASQMLAYLKIQKPSDIEGIVADSNEDLHCYAKTLFTKDVTTVIMGHTHVPCIMVHPTSKLNNIYANSGFLAPDQPSMKAGKSKMTFVETDSSGVVSLKEVKVDRTISNIQVNCTAQKNLPFNYTPADKTGTLSGGLLAVGGGSLLVNVNGVPTKLSDLKPGSIIPNVKDIQLKTPGEGKYGYQVVVTATDGRMEFHFVDQSHDNYSLSVLTTLLKHDHETSYDSVNPLIEKITYKKI